MDRGRLEGPEVVKATGFSGEGQSPSVGRFISIDGHRASKESPSVGNPDFTPSTPKLQPKYVSPEFVRSSLELMNRY